MEVPKGRAGPPPRLHVCTISPEWLPSAYSVARRHLNNAHLSDKIFIHCPCFLSCFVILTPLFCHPPPSSKIMRAHHREMRFLLPCLSHEWRGREGAR